MRQTLLVAVPGRGSYLSPWCFNGTMSMSPSAVALVARCGHHSADRFSPTSGSSRPGLETWPCLTHIVTWAARSAWLKRTGINSCPLKARHLPPSPD